QPGLVSQPHGQPGCEGRGRHRRDRRPGPRPRGRRARADLGEAEAAHARLRRVRAEDQPPDPRGSSGARLTVEPPGGTAMLAGRRVARMGYGAMQLPGPGVWGPPRDRDMALAVLRRAVELGVNHIDTAQYYGPDVANEL